MINQTTEFSVTGNLTRRIEVPSAEVLCTVRREKRTLNIHVPFLSFDLAKMACDKYAMNSMVGPFQVNHIITQRAIISCPGHGGLGGLPQDR